MPIEHEGNVLGEALAQLVIETPMPDEAPASLLEAWAKVEFKE